MSQAETRLDKKHYKDLLVWQKSMVLVREVYDLTSAFPGRERFGLADQMRRAAVSVPSNIAEGQAHHSNREFVHFLRHARGSLAELNTQLMISIDLGYVSQERGTSVLQRIDEISRMLSGLVGALTAE